MTLLRLAAAVSCGISVALLPPPAEAQQIPPAPGWAAPPPPPIPAASSSSYTSSNRRASSVESGTLYVVSAAYGIGAGIWLDAELELEDPALLMIPPTLLGVAAPLGAYILNRPTLPRGVPGAIAAGLTIGAGEGLGIASVQMISADADEGWGFVGLSRAVALGASIGGVAGYAVGVLQEPSPNISLFATSGVVWGSLVGGALGLGATHADQPYREANDWMGRGGLIGFNAGLVVTMGLSTLFVPTLDQLSWMWIGGSVGAAVSLPVYLFYIGDGGPPMKRGLVFSATATTLGIVAGGVFGPQFGGVARGEGGGQSWASVDYVAPMRVPGGAGLQVGGSLF